LIIYSAIKRPSLLNYDQLLLLRVNYLLVPSFISLVWRRHEAWGLGRHDGVVALKTTVYKCIDNLVAVNVIFPIAVIHLDAGDFPVVGIAFVIADHFYGHVVEGVDQGVVILDTG
jgi:hypothetical protein